MAQVIENRTAVEGVISARQAHLTLSAFDVLEVDVQRAAALPGMADLLSTRVPGALAIAVRRELLPAGELRGWSLRAHVTLAGPAFIRVVGAPDSFRVAPP